MDRGWVVALTFVGPLVFVKHKGVTSSWTKELGSRRGGVFPRLDTTSVVVVPIKSSLGGGGVSGRRRLVVVVVVTMVVVVVLVTVWTPKQGKRTVLKKRRTARAKATQIARRLREMKESKAVAAPGRLWLIAALTKDCLPPPFHIFQAKGAKSTDVCCCMCWEDEHAPRTGSRAPHYSSRGRTARGVTVNGKIQQVPS